MRVQVQPLTKGHLPINSPPSPEDWVSTAKGLLGKVGCLGSLRNIHRLMKQKNGLPYQKMSGTLLFHVPTVLTWLERQPGHNLPAA